MSASSQRVLHVSSNRMTSSDTNAASIAITNSPAKGRPIIDDQGKKEKENHRSMMAIPMPSFLRNDRSNFSGSGCSNSYSNSNSNSSSSNSNSCSSDSKDRSKADRTNNSNAKIDTSSHNDVNTNPSFFIDTDMFAQQLAAAVTDETRLSDAILDLIPPPMNHHHHHTEMIVPSTSINTPRNNAAKPLAPPPGLLQLKALSPPKELLPEFTKPSTTTSPTKMSISSKKLEIKRTLGTKSTLPLKRKALDVLCSSSTKAFSSDTTSSKPAIHSRSMNKSTTRSRTTKIKNNSFGCEKTMKEPQSGDLYECILTKRNGGLGLTLACVDDHVQITGLAPDTPAATSGIAVGDTLVAVFGLPVRGLQFSTVISRLKSASRNSVDLKLRRNPFRHHEKNTSTSSSDFSLSSSRQLKRSTQAITLSNSSKITTSGTSNTCTSTSSNSTSRSNNIHVLHPKAIALENRLVGINTISSNGNGHSVVSSLTTISKKIKQEPKGNQTDVISVLSSSPSSSSSLHTLSTKTVKRQKEEEEKEEDNSNATRSASSLNLVTQQQACVHCEEKKRYYEECRALKQEMACLIQQNALQKRHHHRYSEELRGVFDSIQQELKQHKVDQQKQDELTKELHKTQETIQLLTEQKTIHLQAQVDRIRLEIVLKMDTLLHELTLLTSTQRLEGICPRVFKLLFGTNSSEKKDTMVVDMDLTWTYIGQMVDMVRMQQKVLVTCVLMLDQYIENQKEKMLNVSTGHFKLIYFPHEQALEIIFQHTQELQHHNTINK